MWREVLRGLGRAKLIHDMDLLWQGVCEGNGKGGVEGGGSRSGEGGAQGPDLRQLGLFLDAFIDACQDARKPAHALAAYKELLGHSRRAENGSSESAGVNGETNGSSGVLLRGEGFVSSIEVWSAA